MRTFQVPIDLPFRFICNSNTLSYIFVFPSIRFGGVNVWCSYGSFFNDYVFGNCSLWFAFFANPQTQLFSVQRAIVLNANA